MTTIKDPPSGHTDPPAADDHSATLSDASALASVKIIQDAALDATSRVLRLTVEHPLNAVCVIRVHGELDMCTTPLLEACLREQLGTHPNHLIVDLQPVCFLDCSGMNCLLSARENAGTTATQLHLAGLVTRAVARPLQVSQLAEAFNTYPTITHALTTIIN